MRTIAILAVLIAATVNAQQPEQKEKTQVVAKKKEPTKEDINKSVTVAAVATTGFLGLGTIGLACFGFGAFFSYLLPTWIAMMRSHHNTGSILVLNLLLGWSVIGWIVALAFSMSAVQKTLEREPERRPAARRSRA